MGVFDFFKKARPVAEMEANSETEETKVATDEDNQMAESSCCEPPEEDDIHSENLEPTVDVWAGIQQNEDTHDCEEERIPFMPARAQEYVKPSHEILSKEPLQTGAPLRALLEGLFLREENERLVIPFGTDEQSRQVFCDCTDIPNLLVTGASGSGKSAFLRGVVAGILCRYTPSELRLILADPKMIEFGEFNGLPSLLIPVVTDVKKLSGTLQWTVTECIKRQRALADTGCRNLDAYNEMCAVTHLSRIVVVVDEFSFAMDKELEEAISNIAYNGRAVGVHMIMSTQQYTPKVLTKALKAAFLNRVAFTVFSKSDSIACIDSPGAETLEPRVEALAKTPSLQKAKKITPCYVPPGEIAKIIGTIRWENSSRVDYDDKTMEEIEQHVQEKMHGKFTAPTPPREWPVDDYDELLPLAIEVVVETGMASVSMLQRRLKLGYSSAARLLDQMEEKGVVGPYEGARPRIVLITKEQWREIQRRQNMLP